MEDNEFWLKLWQTVILGAVLAFAVGVASCQMTREKVTRAIEAGADPVAAACSLGPPEGISATTCHDAAKKHTAPSPGIWRGHREGLWQVRVAPPCGSTPHRALPDVVNAQW